MKTPENKTDWAKIAKWAGIAIVIITLIVMMISGLDGGHGHEH